MEINAAKLRKELDTLSRLKFELEEQDTLIREQDERYPGTAVGSPQLNLLENIIAGVNSLRPNLVMAFERTDNPLDLRPQIRSARARVDEEISGLQQMLAEHAARTSLTTNPRRVFVVHGRNRKARDAMFDFLRAIDLDPIEWGEAITMTNKGTPHPEEVLRTAFTNAQAGVILFTGDDMARVGKRFVLPHDQDYERSLTPQPRPNVLFEAGMAWGRFSDRTIIVELGMTRPLSDIAGLHTVRISNGVANRQALADRLRTAHCPVKTEGRDNWHTTGDFDAAICNPDIPDGPNRHGLKISRREAQDDQKANVKHKIWIEIRNDSDDCHEIRYAGWKPGPVGIQSPARSGAFQLKLNGVWYPENKGVERLKLPPGEITQTWIKPGDQYSMEDLEQRCQTEGRIGTLMLLIDGAEAEFHI